MRITTNAMMRNYGSSLSNALEKRTSTMEKVNSGRKFSRAYEDPSGASRVLQLNRSYFRTEVYISSVSDAESRLDSAEGALAQVTTLVGQTLEDETFKAINGTSSAETRKTYATSLRQLQQSLMQYSNSTYQDKYLFAGADGGNMAFTSDSSGNIFYRGINVTTGEWSGGTPEEGLAQLAKLSDEKLYLDIGLGMQTNVAGNQVANNPSDFNDSSAYNMSISGIGFMGYGTVEGTDISKNVMVLLGQMADELEKDDFNIDRFDQMRTQMKENHNEMADFEANIGVRSTFLENTKTRMKDDLLSLYKEINSISEIQPETAIMEYSYAQYAYTMVLKVGSTLLTSSLLDFVK